MNNQESSNDSNSNSNSSRDVGLDTGIFKTSPQGDEGPPGGPLEADCISISSDSDCSQEPTARPSRCSSLSQALVSASSNSNSSGSSSSSSSSKEGAKGEAPLCVLVESDEDSDYKHDVLALLDSDGETADGGLSKPQQQGATNKSSSSSRIDISSISSSSSSSGSGDALAVSADAEFEFPCIYDLFANYNTRFFGGRLSHVEVKWSSRMTLCAGLCVYRSVYDHLLSLWMNDSTPSPLSGFLAFSSLTYAYQKPR
ncbi:hypothetical protein Emag_001989 [Eimeria magna]